MGVVLTATFGIIVWIVTWAIGFKSFDGFMIALLIALLAVVVRMFAPMLPGNRPE
jgi:hypothetical protein